MTPEERAARAIAIRAMLDDPTVKDAWASIEAELVTEWRRTFDAAERENIWRAINIMDRLQAWMRSAASADLTALRRVK